MELYLIWLTKIFHKYQDIYNFIDAEDIENVFNSNSINLELPESIKSSLLSSKLKDEAKYEYDYCLKNGIKHCLGCPSAQMETLLEACEVHGVDVNEILSQINK